MSYEVTCPSCHVRLTIHRDVDDALLICPRCLNLVPHPAQPLAGTAVPVTRVTARPGRAVPSVESEVKFTSWTAYFIILALTILTVVRVVLSIKKGGELAGSSIGKELSVLFFLVIVLTILILYPIGRGLFRATAPGSGAAPGNRVLRTFAIIVSLVVLAPIVFFVAFLAVCTATLVGH